LQEVSLNAFKHGPSSGKSVGASLLAKGSRAPLRIWFYALSFTTIASKLAPTGLLARFDPRSGFSQLWSIRPIVLLLQVHREILTLLITAYNKNKPFFMKLSNC
jgi:hypothetical protein